MGIAGYLLHILCTVPSHQSA